MRIVIADDEDAARGLLADLLAKEARDDAPVDVVAACADGEEAVDAVLRFDADVVFLDVEMPACNGIDAARRLVEVAPDVRVVFVTAYDEYAVRAFEVNAVDYLLKPFDQARLHQTVDRLRAVVAGDGADHGRRVAAAISGVHTGRGEEGFLVSHVSGSLRIIAAKDVVYCTSEGNYVRVHTPDESQLVRTTLTALETDLGSARFVRLSRSALARIDQIRQLEPLGHGDYRVELLGGASLTLSRRYRERLEKALGRSL